MRARSKLVKLSLSGQIVSLFTFVAVLSFLPASIFFLAEDLAVGGNSISLFAEFRSSVSENDFGGVLARPFSLRNNGTIELPCLPPDDLWRQPTTQRSPAREGFLFVKEMKTGGSTAAGIHLRIAHNVARRRKTGYPLCKVRNDHATATHLDYQHRDRSKSFLWTVIRDPTRRALSQFFHFQVSRKGIRPTDENFISWIRQDQYLFRYYLRTLSVDPVVELHPDKFDPVLIANGILDEYDFIGVTERMEETAVALQLLLGLNTADILYSNAKMNGHFDDGADERRGCVYIVPPEVSPGMLKIFKTPYWRFLTETDALLHQAANRSLDLTIDMLGRDHFEKHLGLFRHAMSSVEATCTQEIKFPCTTSGEKVDVPDCLWMDSACGMGCLDQVAKDLQLLL